MILEKPSWFIKRGYLLQMSYKFDFFLRMTFMLFNILTYYFIAMAIVMRNFEFSDHDRLRFRDSLDNLRVYSK